MRGAYVAGWIKRGPTGFIGTNKSCALQTVHELVADYNAGLLADPAERPAALDKLVRARRPDVVDAAGWRAIDAAEIARGAAAGPSAQQVHRGRGHVGGGRARRPNPQCANGFWPASASCLRLVALRRSTARSRSMSTSRTVWASDQWCPNGSRTTP